MFGQFPGGLQNVWMQYICQHWPQNSSVWWLQTHVEWDWGGKGCVRIHLTGKQCTITTSALHFFTYLLIEATCSDGVSVYFLGPYVEIQAGENHSNASREMIDMGAFLVMYKNVPLIAVHSCSGACWKIPSPPRAPGPPSPGNVSPHQTQRWIWCTSAHPFPRLSSTPSSYSCSRLGTHTLVCTEIQSDA